MNALLRYTLAAGLACAGAAQAAAPVANNDSYQTGQGQMMTIAAPGVLGNDTADDPNALTASKVSDPLYGTLTLNSDGSFTYNPNSTFYGSDSFSYQASDGSASDQAVVSLTVTSSAGGGGGGGGYGSGGALSPALLALLGLLALYPRGLKPPKRRAISP